MQYQEKTISTEQIAALAASPAGQALMKALQERDPGAVSQAARQARAGSYDDARQSLEALLHSPDIQRLVAQLRDSHG